MEIYRGSLVSDITIMKLFYFTKAIYKWNIKIYSKMI